MRYLFTMASLIIFLSGSMLIGEDWPHWRGPSHNGVSGESGLPVSWGAKCLPKSPVADRGNVGFSASAQAAAFVQRGGFPGQRGFGGREGRPMTPLACANFEEHNVSWKLPLPAYSGSTPIIFAPASGFNRINLAVHTL